jgi:hypothetical protein
METINFTAQIDQWYLIEKDIMDKLLAQATTALDQSVVSVEIIKDRATKMLAFLVPMTIAVPSAILIKTDGQLYKHMLPLILLCIIEVVAAALFFYALRPTRIYTLGHIPTDIVSDLTLVKEYEKDAYPNFQ